MPPISNTQRDLPSTRRGSPLRGQRPSSTATAAAYLKFVSESLNQKLPIMLMMKDAWELALIYARYGAKTIPLNPEPAGVGQPSAGFTAEPAAVQTKAG